LLGGLSAKAIPGNRDKTPGKTSNAENVNVPATVDELLSTMQVVPSASPLACVAF
jgi:hypothetical protein